MSITAGTTARGLPYPGHAGSADGPTAFKALADAIEAMMNSPLVLGLTLSTTKLTISGATGQVEARAQNATGNVVFAAKRTADTTDLLQILANGTVKVSGGSGSLASAMVPGATGVVDFPNGFTGRRVDSPYFRAYRSSAASYLLNDVVVFNTDDADPNSWYDTATGKFQPTTAGRYRLSWAVRAAAALSADVYWATAALKNGAATSALGSIAYQRGSHQPTSIGTTLVAANGSSDYFQIVVDHGAGGAVAVDPAAGLTYFEAERIGA